MSLDGNEMMMELFRAEVESHSESLYKSLLQLERDPSDTSVFEPMMRAAHSIKGAAKIVRVDLAVALAHIIEDCFVAAQHGELAINPDDVDVLLRGIDLLVHIAEATRDKNVSWEKLKAEVEDCVDQLRCLREGRPITSQPSPIQPSQPSPIQPSQPSPSQPSQLSPSQPSPIQPVPRQPIVSTPVASQSTASPVPNTQTVVPTPSPVITKPRNIRIAVGPALYKSDAEQLRKLLVEQLGPDAESVQIDLSKTQELDPIGLAFLVAAKKHVQSKTNAQVRFEPVSENMQLVLRMSGIQ